MSRKLAAATIAMTALVGLTACTGSPGGPVSSPTSRSSDQPGDEGQSTADACALVAQSIQDATAEFDSIATADPAAVVEAMRSLSEDHRAVLHECYFRGSSVTEAAAALGIPAGTVKSRTHYALRALRLALEERGGSL